MTQPILVVDFGTWRTSAALVVDGRMSMVADPVTGSPVWPSAACLDGENLLVGAAAIRRRQTTPDRYVDGLRRAVDTGVPVRLGDRQANGTDLLSVYLRTIRAETERLYGGRIERLVLSVPPSYRPQDRRREDLVAAAAGAGFPDVALVSDSVAAVLDPDANADLPEGSLALVCDLGVTWKIALVRLDGERTVQLGQETSGGGQDFDALLVNDLRAELRDWIEPALAAEGDAGVRAHYDMLDFVRHLKHRLGDAEQVEGRLAPDAPPYRLNRSWLANRADPALRWLIASGRAVLAREGAQLAEVSAVVLVGGASRLSFARQTLREGLGLPVWHASEPDQAVLRGAVRWASAVTGRQVAANAPGWRVEPLSWEVPDGQARLVRWLVAEGETFAPGAVLAQVRTADDRVYDLTAATDGILAEQRAAAGGVVASGATVGASRVMTAPRGDRPAKRHRLAVTGDWMLMPDRQFLVECDLGGACVKVRAIGSGAVVSELRPSFEGAPRGGQVFVNPSGQLNLVSWDSDGRFSVWNVESGRRTASFRDSFGMPETVLVNESQWRLFTKADKEIQVGRYRRSIATVWDLGTGSRLEKLIDEDWQRRTGYSGRSLADGFAAEMRSPCGRFRAATTQVTGGAGTVSVLDAKTDREVFRADAPVSQSIRAAFSADGQHLLATWKRDRDSWVDVWRI